MTLWKPPHADVDWEKSFFGGLTESAATPLGLKGSALIIPWETAETKYTASFASGATPADVTYQVVPWLKKYASAGKLADLRELAPDLIKSVNEQTPESIQNVAKGPNGEIYGVPAAVSHFMLVLNVDLWKAAGSPALPTTYEEMIPFAQALTVDTKGVHYGQPGFDANNVASYGYAFNTDPNYFANYLWAYGASELNAAKDDIGYDNPEGRAALTVMKKMLDSGGAVPLGKYTDPAKFAELIPSGLAAFGWIPGVSDETVQRYPNLKLKVMDIPAGPAGQFVVGGAGYWAVSEGSKNKKAAAKLLASLTAPDKAKEFMVKIPAFPANGAADGYFDAMKNPVQKETLNAASAQGKYVRLNDSAAFNPTEAIITTTTDYLLGRSTLDEAIASASSQVKTLAANAK
ncbi:extracellular solute-binding protein [Microbacterium sp. 2MCAF23]|uniref:extracellular solute-binding protein n=1 Tax=Microbacterium sp. 2MCAF23 TaxID=3232985 RepID=UPI003F9E9FF2